MFFREKNPFLSHFCLTLLDAGIPFPESIETKVARGSNNRGRSSARVSTIEIRVMLAFHLTRQQISRRIQRIEEW